ncbi:hypothetical protein BH11MYX1_BH11MYX1_04870 [soil metagenome]
MKRLLLALVGTVACGSAGSALPDAFVATISSVAVTPGSVTAKRGLSQPAQLTAKLSLSDSTTLDITNNVTWASSDSTVAAVSETGRVTPLAVGTAMVTATYEGVTSTASAVTVPSTTMILSDLSNSRLNIYDAYTDGPALRQIVGTNTTLTAPWGVSVYHDELFVADQNAIEVFPANAAGNVVPTRRITGALGASYNLAVYKDEIYVANGTKILVFPVTANGNVAPTRTVGGAMTGLSSAYGLAVYKDEIYVTNFASVSVFPTGANGDLAPTRKITGSHTLLNSCYGVFVENDEVYVTNLDGIRVWLTTSDGDVSPIRNLTGASTSISSATGVNLLGNELYVTNAGPTGTHAYPASVTGDAAPTRTISNMGTTNARTVTFY